ncbi:hypothetical protein [Novosphingobium sp. LASN5T]|uniref:hypothetical protein n=1 Tax=Novosphingobium sp. LASN5T TaxID=2491021 RepID=UPI000F5F7C16|nr:hypothetical protein [Novosphingobium sp. LASN5T]RQW40603.1 hypothetical protein EH199_20635 [Novosphingobium sp. LASN5T]
MSSVALWTSGKTVALTGQQRHRHKGAIATDFTAPALAPAISFNATALSAAIARTATLRAAPPELLAHIGDSARSEAQILLADGPTFALSPLFAHMADSERTHFASRIGAGITDLYMNALGYSWRDNAVCLASALDPHADFLYFGGNALGHGVVLAEARGSFAQNVTDAAMARAAAAKYLRQVRPYIGASSLHGQVIHGYAVAFGAQPTSQGAFLRLSQTSRAKPKGNASPPPVASSAQVPATIALATHRSNFILMDALPVARWIDWVTGAGDIPDDGEPILFVRFKYDGRAFLASIDALAPYRSPLLWHDEFFDHPFWRWHWETRRFRASPFLPFIMEETAAFAFLQALTGLIRIGPRERPPVELLELPVGDVAGFNEGSGEIGFRTAREPYDYALFRDGLALISDLPRRGPADILRWHPREGLDGAAP